MFTVSRSRYHHTHSLIRTSLKLKEFQKFDSAATALEEVAALVEGKVTAKLASLLDSIKDEKKASLAVADPKLGMISIALNGSAAYGFQAMPLIRFLDYP